MMAHYVGFSNLSQIKDPWNRLYTIICICTSFLFSSLTVKENSGLFSAEYKTFLIRTSICDLHQFSPFSFLFLEYFHSFFSTDLFLSLHTHSVLSQSTPCLHQSLSSYQSNFSYSKFLKEIYSNILPPIFRSALYPPSRALNKSLLFYILVFPGVLHEPMTFYFIQPTVSFF